MTDAATHGPAGRTVLRWAPFVIAVTVNLLVLYWPRQVSGAQLFPGVDKVAHVGVFALVALTGVRAGVPLRWLVGPLVIHAVSSELVQHWLLPRRSGDPGDVVADLVGVGLGMALGVATPRAGGSWLHARARARRGHRADRLPAGRDTGAR